MIENTPPGAVVEIPSYCEPPPARPPARLLGRRPPPTAPPAGPRRGARPPRRTRPRRPRGARAPPRAGRRARLLPECLGRGRVLLLGEAAHPAPPTGLEVSMAIEDAAALACAVQEFGVTREALRRAELRRRPRWRHLMQACSGATAARVPSVARARCTTPPTPPPAPRPRTRSAPRSRRPRARA